MTEKEKIKYALEELNRWLRHIDSHLWQISSILLIGNVYALKIVLDDKNVKIIFVIIIGISFIFLWNLYLKFLKNLALKTQKYLNEANKKEKHLIEILPNKVGEFEEELSEDYYSPFVIKKLKYKDDKTFLDVIIYIAYFAQILWGIVIIYFSLFVTIDNIDHIIHLLDCITINI